MTTASRETRTIEGKLLEVNWHARTAQLHTDEGVVQLTFSEELAADFKSLAREEVRVTGTIEDTPRSEVVVSLLSPLTPYSWGRLELDELFASREVNPFVFPTDEPEDNDWDVDEFLELIHEGRSYD